MTFLKRRVSAAVWELLLVLVAAIIFATVYRIYFSRAVTLTQVCERFADAAKRRSGGHVQQDGRERLAQRHQSAVPTAPADAAIVFSMKTIFIDCNPQLGAVWKRVIRPDDPPVTINETPFEKNELPRVDRRP